MVGEWDSEANEVIPEFISKKIKVPKLKEDVSDKFEVFNLGLSERNSWRNMPVNNGELRVPYKAFEKGTERVSFHSRIPTGSSYTLQYDVLFEPG